MLVITRDLLVIYLNDHLAGSTAGRELARRAAGANEGTRYGAVLAELADEIDEDRVELENLMQAMDAGRDRVKTSVAWVAEKAGRLKLNGRLTGYSPLSRVVELEGLIAGVRGKQALWQALRALDVEERPLTDARLDKLVARAESQLDRLNTLHREAAREAFSGRRAGA